MTLEQERKKSLLERATEALDLPSSPLAGLPFLSLVGDKELRLENHKGILAYGKEEIHISGGKVIYKIRGIDLELRGMTAVDLLITGQITAITLE